MTPTRKSLTMSVFRGRRVVRASDWTALLGCAAVIAGLSLGGLATRAGAAPVSHDFSIEQVMSAPLPSSLVAAPQGGHVAWVYDNEGSRNVWVADPGGNGSAKPVTNYVGDDGFDLGEVSWGPDGRLLVYARGGSLEGGGPVNPLSLPSGAEDSQVWVAWLDGAPPRQIGPGNSPVVSPKGDVVAYVQGGQIWTAPLAAGGAPAQLIHDRGESDTPTWSPDGTRLAFVSARGDHGFIGVYDFAAKAITWLGPSVDTDVSPEWSPDGHSIAFIRIAAGRPAPLGDRRVGQPWSIWVGDAATGAARNIWTASAGEGSVFHSLESDRTLFWAAGDRLVFPWEQSGWLQLYAVPAQGGAPVRLTHGDFEAFSATISPDRKRIVYSANQDDTDHRHIWAVAVDGGEPQALTRGPSIEDDPVVTADGQVAALHGDWRKPLGPVWVASPSRLVDLAPQVPADFPDARFSEPQPVIFDAADGLKIHGQLFLPPPGRASRGPAILFFHGGPPRQMLLGWHPMDAYNYMYALNQYLADEGYVVLSVNYRGGSGYGLDFRQPPKFGAAGSSEFNDILGSAMYLRTRADVDPKRIGIYGASYGGLMTALGLSRASDYLAAGVDYAGVHDWTKLGQLYSGPNAPKDAEQIAYDASAMATLDRWTSPVLVVHSDDDRNVPFSQSVELVEGLRKHGVEVQQLIIPDEIHDMLRQGSWIRFFHATDDFLADHLHPREAGAASSPAQTAGH
jgi:dipeptidyl aminopeptidase/acylaminoacyl peptidase